MNLKNLKFAYSVACVVLIFIIISPTLISFVTFPDVERFSELYLLGADRTVEGVPSDILAKMEYNVIFGTGNHMHEVEYYYVTVKLRNQTDVYREVSFDGPSSLEPLTGYRLFLKNEEFQEKEFLFIFDDVSVIENVSHVSTISINDNRINIDKTAVWDNERNGFFYQLLFELWIYNSTLSSFEFNGRSTWFWVNLTIQN